ncbi:MAG: DUF4382 domain-containing protein, partial [Thaumarchaeota archaeon]|nr:DUF4382 domain-containing protein [Nitrososphaerota archaeon]
MKTAYAIGIAIVIVLAIAVAAFVGLPYLQPSQTTSGTNTSNGQLAMMATDPPITASGVSAASIMYAGAAAHTSGSSSDSGWVQVAGSGSLDLMANAQAQTIASSNVAAGTYDKVRFDVTSASVTYNGKQYPCAVASGTLTTNLESNVQVNAAAKAAALVDVRTFIINSANSSNPQFVFTATAKATAAPSSVATSSNLQVGSK